MYKPYYLTIFFIFPLCTIALISSKQISFPVLTASSSTLTGTCKNTTLFSSPFISRCAKLEKKMKSHRYLPASSDILISSPYSKLASPLPSSHTPSQSHSIAQEDKTYRQSTPPPSPNIPNIHIRQQLLRQSLPNPIPPLPPPPLYIPKYLPIDIFTKIPIPMSSPLHRIKLATGRHAYVNRVIDFSTVPELGN